MKAAPSLEYLRQHREAILELVARYGGAEVHVFGSVARGEATPDSDVDLLVTFKHVPSVFELVALWQELGDLLGYPPSVIPKGAENQPFMRRALREGVAL